MSISFASIRFQLKSLLCFTCRCVLQIYQFASYRLVGVRITTFSSSSAKVTLVYTKNKQKLLLTLFFYSANKAGKFAILIFSSCRKELKYVFYKQQVGICHIKYEQNDWLYITSDRHTHTHSPHCLLPKAQQAQPVAAYPENMDRFFRIINLSHHQHQN